MNPVAAPAVQQIGRAQRAFPYPNPGKRYVAPETTTRIHRPRRARSWLHFWASVTPRPTRRGGLRSSTIQTLPCVVEGKGRRSRRDPPHWWRGYPPRSQWPADGTSSSEVVFAATGCWCWPADLGAYFRHRCTLSSSRWSEASTRKPLVSQARRLTSDGCWRRLLWLCSFA